MRLARAGIATITAANNANDSADGAVYNDAGDISSFNLLIVRYQIGGEVGARTGERMSDIRGIIPTRLSLVVSTSGLAVLERFPACWTIHLPFFVVPVATVRKRSNQ